MSVVPERRILTVNVTAAPGKLPRWYFAALDLLIEATDCAPNRQTLDRRVMIESGYFESVVINSDGTTRFSPVSRSGWDRIEWRTFIDRSFPILLRFAGESHARFRGRVDAFFGIKLREIWDE